MLAPCSACPVGTFIERRHDPAAVEGILRLLPEWFGIDDAIAGYVRNASTFPSYLAVDTDGVVIGIALLERHFPLSAEIHLLAVHPDEHRNGVGRALVGAIEGDLRADGARMLQVHTVGPSYPDEAYAKTREFYQGIGFVPLQEFDEIDWHGPTLVLVKAL